MSLSKRLATRLVEIRERHEEIATLLANVEVVHDQERYVPLAREYSELQPLVDAYKRIEVVANEIEQANELLDDDDLDLRQLAVETIDEQTPHLDAAVEEIERLLLPTDPNDNANVFLEIRAGTGGDEAAIFAGDLAKMYERYSATRGWQSELVNGRPGDHGGFKEAIYRISGNDVFSRLKFESGAHRVQRVPETESQGRIHTSACTVAILPEIEEISDVEIKDTDLRIDKYRASGAGGQHVNKTDSAVRITHIPTGTVVECQDERSQHQNRERAMALLTAKLLDAKRSEQQAERTQERKIQVGSGDRSERIRTYNFPQGRITDHRVHLTLYKLDEILEGSMDQLIEPIIREFQADQLNELRGDSFSSHNEQASDAR